jgi:hypothetical protein
LFDICPATYFRCLKEQDVAEGILDFIKYNINTKRRNIEPERLETLKVWFDDHIPMVSGRDHRMGPLLGFYNLYKVEIIEPVSLSFFWTILQRQCSCDTKSLFLFCTIGSSAWNRISIFNSIIFIQFTISNSCNVIHVLDSTYFFCSNC